MLGKHRNCKGALRVQKPLENLLLASKFRITYYRFCCPNLWPGFQKVVYNRERYATKT